MPVAYDALKAGQIGGKEKRSGDSAFVSRQFITIPSTPRTLEGEQVSNHPRDDELCLIDQRGLLFRPVPATPVLRQIPVTPYPDFMDEGELRLQQRKGGVHLPGVPSLIQALTIPLPVPVKLPIKRRTGKRAILWSSVLAAGVLLVYLVEPLVLTLVPFLPTNWSRVLIAFQLLLLAEVVIYRILFRTTRRNSRHKAEGKAV